MKRQPYTRVKPIRDPAARKRWAAAKTIAMKGRCQCCHGKPDWRGMHTHHLIRWRRSDEPTNWLLVCAVCHDAIHGLGGPRITLGQTLSIKQIEDEAEFDLRRLNALHESPVELEPLPGWLVEMRKESR